MTETVFWIWFQLVFGIASRRAELLLHYFENPREIFEGIAAKNRIYTMLDAKELAASERAMVCAQDILRRTLKKGCQVITPQDELYPKRLAQIYSKPAALYVKGDLSCLKNTLAIGMVGTRHHTKYGRDAAEEISKGLARNGVVIVSGLAVGIDTQCHESAVEVGGKTIGVLGCGIDIDYPKGSADIKRQVSQNGAVITEYPLGTNPHAFNFPVRNRIISGLSHGVVVVEADMKSGSMITANHAMEQGRDVFAVPGSIFSLRQQGTHQLIRDGAKLVECAGDILEEYAHLGVLTDTTQNKRLFYVQEDAAKVNVVETQQAKKEKSNKKTKQIKSEDNTTDKSTEQTKQNLPQDVSDIAKEVYEQFNSQMITVDNISSATNLNIGEILTALTELEIFGLIQGYAGRRFGLK